MRHINKGTKYGNKVYEHCDVRVVETGIVYTVWLDYVTASHMQPRCDTLKAAAQVINDRRDRALSRWGSLAYNAEMRRMGWKDA